MGLYPCVEAILFEHIFKTNLKIDKYIQADETILN